MLIFLAYVNQDNPCDCLNPIEGKLTNGTPIDYGARCKCECAEGFGGQKCEYRKN